LNDQSAVRSCPGCGYDLRLLSSPACPECGLPCGPSTRTFTFRQPRSYLARIWCVLAHTLRVLLTLWFGLAALGALRSGRMPVLLISAILLAPMVVWWFSWFGGRGTYTVLLSPDQVILVKRGTQPQRISLKRIWCAEYELLSGEIVIRNRTGKILGTIPSRRVSREFLRDTCLAISNAAANLRSGVRPAPDKEDKEG
jgi:hypothetical protein